MLIPVTLAAWLVFTGDSITGAILGVWIVWSLNPMKSSKASLKRKSASILKPGPARRAAPIRVGVESMDDFFSRMKDCD